MCSLVHNVEAISPGDACSGCLTIHLGFRHVSALWSAATSSLGTLAVDPGSAVASVFRTEAYRTVESVTGYRLFR